MTNRTPRYDSDGDGTIETTNTDHTAADHESGGSLALTLGNLASMDAVEVLIDTAANRPAAGTADRLFFETDNGRVMYDTGSTWTILGTTNTDDTDHRAANHEAGGSLEITHNNLTLGSSDHHTRPAAGTGLVETSGNFDLNAAASGTATLTSGLTSIDTGVGTASTATFMVALGPATSDAEVAADVRADSGSGTYQVDIQETDTSVGNPDVAYDVIRVR